MISDAPSAHLVVRELQESRAGSTPHVTGSSSLSDGQLSIRHFSLMDIHRDVITDYISPVTAKLRLRYNVIFSPVTIPLPDRL
jgi:hypothetical protein